MNLKKAIEIKEAYHTKFGNHMLSQERFADRLSIEAMKDHLKARAAGWFPPGYKLPGETED